jgi:hypothetical protein
VDVDEALEESTFRNTDALRNQIPDQGTFTGDVYTFAGIDVALHLSQNHHPTGTDIRQHRAISFPQVHFRLHRLDTRKLYSFQFSVPASLWLRATLREFLGSKVGL